MSAQDVILSDLSACLPGDALTRESRNQGTWMLFDYETEASGDGGFGREAQECALKYSWK